MSVLLGNGDGTFQRPDHLSPPASSPESVAVGDVNGDGKPDLIVANYDGGNTVSVLLGNGNGTFQTAGHLRPGSSPRPWRSPTSTATASPTSSSPTSDSERP